MYEEDSKKIRIFQREKRQELQLIIERCNKIPFDYVCKPQATIQPLEMNKNVVFGSSAPRKIYLFASDKSVNSYMRRFFNEHFEEFPREKGTSENEDKLVSATVPFSSKVPRFLTLLSESQGYRRRRKKPQEVISAVDTSNFAFGSRSERKYQITRDQRELISSSFYHHLNLDSKPVIFQSFGGKTSRISAYDIVCTPKNQESKCNLCEEEIKNVYWRNSKNLQVLCRSCYKLTLHEIKNKSKGVLERFHKLRKLENDFSRKRHCEFVHEHHNTKAAVSIFSKKEIDKRIKKENFLQSKFHY